MQIAIFGLGKMGAQIARRLQKNNFEVLAWNRSEGPREEVAKAGVKAFANVDEVVKNMQGSPRVFWVMLLQEVVEDFLQNQLGPHLKPGDIVIDGGNTFYKESMRRGKEFAAKGIHFFDCGTSGGVWGEANGFAMMIGGPKEAWPHVDPFFKALSAGENYGLMGTHGSGHFVKMVHNGIEYGMMEAIAEGYAVMKASPFELDLAKVTKIYQEGSVVRSWLIDLTRNIFENEDVEGTSGYIHQLGEGKWTVDAGKEFGVDVRVLEDSVKVRDESADPKNQDKFSNKIVALLRKQFGGHAIRKES
jgi:6-phosphogluconate dehydrogenase